MKRKFSKILGVGLALVLALSLSLVAAMPVAASPEVTDVWLEFPGAVSWTDSVGAPPTSDSNLNETNVDANMIVHFTATNALKANIDTITIYFPDGSTELSGSGNTDGTFTITDATLSRGIKICVDPDGAGTTYGYYKINASATAAGYRLKLTTPIDIAAGAKPYVFISGNGCNITNSSVEGHEYKIKMQTSKDTSLVTSSTFALGATAKHVTIDTGGATTYVPLTAVAGSATQFTFGFNVANALTAGQSKITVIFPAGTDVPSITADQIECQYYTGGTPTVSGGTPSGYQQVSGTVTVNSDARMVTFTSPVDVTKGCQVKFKSTASINLPQTITEPYESGQNYALLDYYIYTSADRLMEKGTSSGIGGNFKISPSGASKLAFNNDALAGETYSADCAIVNGFTGDLYLQMQDDYGNLIFSGTGSDVAVTLVTTAGNIYTEQDTTKSTGSKTLTDGEATLYFRATTAIGSPHTITASYGSYDAGIWEVTVAPAVLLEDANGNTVNTFAPLSSDTTPTDKGGHYIKEAISAAMAGDTIKLGEGIYDITTDIVSASKAVTIEAVSGTTPVLRCTGTPNDARMKISKGATIDGLTFRGLRWDTSFDGGFIQIHPTSTTGPTIQNCTFEDFKTHYGAIYWITISPAETAVTSGSISNNIFQNLIGDWDDCASVVSLEAHTYNISGVTISNNIFLNNAMMAINVCVSWMTASTTITITGVTISGNTISSNRSNEGGIDLCTFAGTKHGVLGSAAAPIKIIDNEISGCMDQAIRLQEGRGEDATFSEVFPGVRIKQNYIHDNAEEAIKLMGGSMAGSTTALNAGALEIMYNDIVDNAQVSDTHAIKNTLADASATIKVTAQYNWFGDASGPGGSGDTVSSYVVYSPWLYKSRTFVVNDDANYCAQTISLGIGINTLSTPALLITTADTIAKLMPDYDTKMDYCYKFVNGVYTNIGTDPLTPCHAYYIKMLAADTVLLQYAADEYYTPTRLLEEGWNLIGLANLSSMAEKDAVASVLKDSAGLPGYSQVISPSMNTASWSYSAGAVTSQGDMEVGEGYWIWMQNDATLAGFTIFPLVPDLD